MLVRASSTRTLGPFMRGPTNVVHTETLELCVLVEGALAVKLADWEGWHRPNEVSVIPPGVAHSCWTEAEGASEVIVHLEPAGLGALQAGIWPLPRPVVERMARALGPKEREDAVLAILDHLRAAVAMPVVRDPRLSRVIAAVREDLASPWSLPALARAAGMSTSAFRRAFTAAVGTSPVAWVIDQRVAAAEHLLRDTDRSVGENALLVGFGSPSRLTEAFARRHALTPSAWRANRARL